jgi:WSC domain-containing protein
LQNQYNITLCRVIGARSSVRISPLNLFYYIVIQLKINRFLHRFNSSFLPSKQFSYQTKVEMAISTVANPTVATVTSFQHLGCFTENPARLLDNALDQATDMTPELCYSYCNGGIGPEQFYTFMGVENGNQCFCGNTIPQNLGQPVALHLVQATVTTSVVAMGL